jgi:hypothetical protein
MQIKTSPSQSPNLGVAERFTLGHASWKISSHTKISKITLLQQMNIQLPYTFLQLVSESKKSPLKTDYFPSYQFHFFLSFPFPLLHFFFFFSYHSPVKIGSSLVWMMGTSSNLGVDVVSQSFLSKKLESPKHKVQQSQKDHKI